MANKDHDTRIRRHFVKTIQSALTTINWSGFDAKGFPILVPRIAEMHAVLADKERWTLTAMKPSQGNRPIVLIKGKTEMPDMHFDL